MILAPISLGELIDRITILQIKSHHLSGPALENVANQLRALEATLDGLNLGIHPELVQQLKAVNAGLWDIENEIREKERSQDFGDAFIRLARSVYQQNDRRAVIKMAPQQNLWVQTACSHGLCPEVVKACTSLAVPICRCVCRIASVVLAGSEPATASLKQLAT